MLAPVQSPVAQKVVGNDAAIEIPSEMVMSSVATRVEVSIHYKYCTNYLVQQASCQRDFQFCCTVHMSV